MNTRIPTPALQAQAMLVKLTRSMFNSAVTDREATQLVSDTMHVQRAGRFQKVLFKDSSKFADLQRAYGELYAYHQRHTLPWVDAGPRLLPAKQYFEYTQEMRTLRAACDNALAVFHASYSSEVAKDKARLGALARDEDYPADIRQKFSHDVQFMPVPSSGDFRVEISAEDRASLESAISEAEAGMASHIIKELLEPLQHAASKLATPVGEKGAIFRDSLIENLVDVCQRLPKLDITGDPAIAKAISDTKALVDRYMDADALRKLPEFRESAAKAVQSQVDDILKNFGGI